MFEDNIGQINHEREREKGVASQHRAGGQEPVWNMNVPSRNATTQNSPKNGPESRNNMKKLYQIYSNTSSHKTGCDPWRFRVPSYSTHLGTSHTTLLANSREQGRDPDRMERSGESNDGELILTKRGSQ